MYTLMRKTELADNRTLKQKIKQKPLQKRQYQMQKPNKSSRCQLKMTYIFRFSTWNLNAIHFSHLFWIHEFCRNNLAIPVIRIIYI